MIKPKPNCLESEFVQLNFQLVDNARSIKITNIKRQNFDVGEHILPNRMHVLNNMMEKDWLNLSYDTFKVYCKALFLAVRKQLEFCIGVK